MKNNPKHGRLIIPALSFSSIYSNAILFSHCTGINFALQAVIRHGIDRKISLVIAPVQIAALIQVNALYIIVKLLVDNYFSV